MVYKGTFGPQYAGKEDEFVSRRKPVFLKSTQTIACARLKSLLKKAGFSDAAVCAVSGHKNVAV